MAGPSSTSGAMVEYPYPSHVFVQNFVTVRLAGRDSYKLWKTQMRCLLESHGMLGFIDGTLVSPTQSCSKSYMLWRGSDALVKGWILGSLTQQTLRFILDRLHSDHFTAKDVWEKLQTMYGPALLPNTIQQDLKEERITRKTESTTRVDSLSNGKRRMKEAESITRVDSISENTNARDREKEAESITRADSISEDADADAKKLEKEAELTSENADAKKLKKEAKLTSENADAKKREKEKEKRERERAKICLKLYRAILQGSWEDVYGILKTNEVKVTDKISINGNTALHVAVGTTTKQKNFVEKMLDMAQKSTLLELKNSDGSTLLHVAATVGNTDAAKILVASNQDLLFAKDNDDQTPLARALSNMHTKTYLYLLEATDIEQGTGFAGLKGDELLVNAISAKDFDLAMYLTSQYKTLNSDAALMAIAQNYPTDVSRWQKSLYNRQHYSYESLVSGAIRRVTMDQVIQLIAIEWPIQIILFTMLKLKVWPSRSIQERVHTFYGARQTLHAVCNLIGDTNDTSSERYYYNNPILEAARLNAYMVVETIVHYFPNAIWSENEDGHNIIQCAVINRSEKVYNLLYQMSEHKNIYKTIKDSYGNNLLHLAGRLAPSNKLNLISGAALQIQRELQWFKEVERFVCPLNKVQKNFFGETPQMVFTREHKDLVIKGEKWMKATAESYTITAALITTIVFAAAITVPGGSNQEKGIPVFSHDKAFKVFAVSDAISLFTSTTSLLMFLSILTARFAEEDFLFKLPTKLIIGLTTLFISTTAMIIAFGATLFLVFAQKNLWILGSIATLTCLPIASFVTLQYPLIADLIRSMFGHRIFGKKRDRPFY